VEWVKASLAQEVAIVELKAPAIFMNELKPR
jgi:hypothetical protein